MPEACFALHIMQKPEQNSKLCLNCRVKSEHLQGRICVNDGFWEENNISKLAALNAFFSVRLKIYLQWVPEFGFCAHVSDMFMEKKLFENPLLHVIPIFA